MISGARRRRIRINITTYKYREYPEYEMEERAKKKCCNKAYHNKFVCAICLNRKPGDRNSECCQKIPKSCPICQKSKDCCGTTKERERLLAEKETFCVMRNKTRDFREKGPVIREKITACCGNVQGRVVIENDDTPRRDPNVKTVQTSDTNVAQGLSLLNEVLTVFQNKKVDINKEKVESKDVAVSTADDENDERSPKDKSKLSVNTFQYSIDEKKNVIENGKFMVVNCCQPIYLKAQNSLDLIKHKSSSIPQMKLEELKYSLKEKSRSKDAIEEVNRMFATVRKGSKFTENSNRPVVRNGPRVLPLVKHPEKNSFGSEQNEIHSCKYCQTCMSSGDSFAKLKCGHAADKGEKCDKCVYMLCCHYEKAHKMETGVLICEHCRNLNDEQCCQKYVDDSG